MVYANFDAVIDVIYDLGLDDIAAKAETQMIRKLLSEQDFLSFQPRVYRI